MRRGEAEMRNLLLRLRGSDTCAPNKTLLSPTGVFYVVAVEQNHPGRIVEEMEDLGLICKVRMETLC